MVDRFNQTADTGRPGGPGQASSASPPSRSSYIASIVQAESGSAEDMPKVARVIYNRLTASRRCQAAAGQHGACTALNKYGIVGHRRGPQSTSPYNTYKHKGLPPGPIDNPGDARHPGRAATRRTATGCTS